jgi:hypothetical protein
MRRFFVCFLSSALLAVVAALPARACINDREVDNAEREFKSQYADPPADVTPTTPAPSPGETLKFYGPLAMGGVFLVGAFVQFRRRPGTPA